MKKLLPEKLRTLLVIGLLSQPFASVMAETTAKDEKVNWYTVEVISFTRAKTAQVQEKWHASVQVDNENGLSNMGMTNNPALSMLEIEAVPNSEKQLGRHAYAINRAPGLSVKSHQIWRQKGLPRNLAPWINLATDSGALNGKVRISLSRYLHADISVQLQNPDWSPSFSSVSGLNEETVTNRISFNASRKLQRDKIHYIDHPLAGILLRIERFEKDQNPVSGEEPRSQTIQSGHDKSKT